MSKYHHLLNKMVKVIMLNNPNKLYVGRLTDYDGNFWQLKPSIEIEGPECGDLISQIRCIESNCSPTQKMMINPSFVKSIESIDGLAV